MTLTEAVQEVMARTDALSNPPISAERVQQIVKARTRVSRFMASVPCRLGQLVIPSASALDAPGALYLCTRAGVTTAEPGWPATAGVPAVSGAVQFRLTGGYDGNPYDLLAAEKQVYREKQAIVARRVSMTSGNEKASLEQQFAHFAELITRDGPEWPC